MTNSKLIISKHRLPMDLALTYIIALGIWDSITNIFILNSIRIILCCVALCLIVGTRKWWKSFSFLSYDILIVLMIAVFCLNNHYIEINNSFGYLRYFLVFALLFVGRTIPDFPNKVVGIYTGMSLLHVFATIWLKFDGWSYRNVVVKLFDAERRSLLLSHYSQGWIPGLANHYSSNGMYIATAILLLFSHRLFVDSPKAKRRLNWLFVLAFLALLFTGKRAHMVFSVVAMLLVYYLFTANRNRGRLFKIIGIVILVLLFFFIGYRLFPGLFSFIGRFIETSQDGDVSQGRYETWAVVWSVFRKNPIWGIGWMQFSTIAEKYAVTTNAHNVYIQLLCETGVIGFTIFFTLFVSMFMVSISMFKRMRRDVYNVSLGEQKNMAFSIGIQAFFLLYCLSGNPLYDAPMFIPYFLALAITLYYLLRVKCRG